MLLTEIQVLDIRLDAGGGGDLSWLNLVTPQTLVVALVAIAVVLLTCLALLLLLFAWLRHVWRRVLRTRTFSQVVKEVSVGRPLLTYRDIFRREPPSTADLTLRVQGKALALETIKDQLGSRERFRVEETTRRYLPDTMGAYRMAVVGVDAQRRNQASRLLVEQLSQLEANLDSIAAGAGESGMAALSANGLFLNEILGKRPDGQKGGPAPSANPADGTRE